MFQCNTVKEAMRETKKRKAMCTDRIAPIHLHHLGPAALRRLTETINLSVDIAKIKKIGKIDRIIRLHRPGKPIGES